MIRSILISSIRPNIFYKILGPPIAFRTEAPNFWRRPAFDEVMLKNSVTWEPNTFLVFTR